jgi:putative two-component system response regulator
LRLIESEILPYRGKKILLVNCEPASRPVFFSRDQEEDFYVRVGNSTQRLNPSEMLAYIDDHYGTAR